MSSWTDVTLEQPNYGEGKGVNPILNQPQNPTKPKAEWTEEIIEQEVEVATYEVIGEPIRVTGTEKVTRKIPQKVAYAALTPQPTCPPDKHHFELVNNR